MFLEFYRKIAGPGCKSIHFPAFISIQSVGFFLLSALSVEIPENSEFAFPQDSFLLKLLTSLDIGIFWLAANVFSLGKYLWSPLFIQDSILGTGDTEKIKTQALPRRGLQAGTEQTLHIPHCWILVWWCKVGGGLYAHPIPENGSLNSARGGMSGKVSPKSLSWTEFWSIIKCSPGKVSRGIRGGGNSVGKGSEVWKMVDYVQSVYEPSHTT